MKAGVAGGFAYGVFERLLGDKIPTIPVLGKKGTVALGIYFLKPTNPLLRDVGFAAAVLAGVELGSTGKISGDVSGVHGFAREV